MMPLVRTVTSLFPRTELVEHTHGALIYIAALSWTHAFLPTVGGNMWFYSVRCAARRPSPRATPAFLLHTLCSPALAASRSL